MRTVIEQEITEETEIATNRGKESLSTFFATRRLISEKPGFSFFVVFSVSPVISCSFW